MDQGRRKRALVTGGSRGLGEAFARWLADQGWQVTIGDLPTEAEAGRRVASEVDGLYMPLDVRSRQDNRNAVQAAVGTGRGLDLAVLNAGRTTGTRPGTNFDEEKFWDAMAVNLGGAAFGVQEAIPALQEAGGGDIVLLSSVAGLREADVDPFYAMVKHGLVGYTRSMARQLAKHDIAINALCPGFADTAIIDNVREGLEQGGTEILTRERVVQGLAEILASDRSGECWEVLPDRPIQPFVFGRVAERQDHQQDIYDPSDPVILTQRSSLSPRRSARNMSSPEQWGRPHTGPSKRL